MGIIFVEVCLISAHGLQHSTSIWKRQWFAVGWIDPNSKYCTKVDDASEDANPVWKTKFAIPVDSSVPNFPDLALNVEVYSLDPIFLTEKLHGTATVVLKAFLDKQEKNSEVSNPRREEVRRYQLRKNKSGKARGFIDISIRVYEEKKESNPNAGCKRGLVVSERGNGTHLTKGGLGQAYPQKQPQELFHQEENPVVINAPNYHALPFLATNYADPYDCEPSYHAVEGSSYQPPRTITPPPPPPPSHVGYIPTFLPRNDCPQPSYKGMLPSMLAPGQKGPPGFATGIGAGALAAGALIFGDDFMSGFDVPPGIGNACLTEDIDPTF